ncbi:hypothetical protein [Sphingomicrobium clamense]|uniref:Uncharacterized protein n=1 Tax=Sphingomicrobium clamense TaxID=2851013 RepID=A0ABS6V5T0_9SPHN|nr:hypothetical protein [Sphingomicrobium sp. B8]MBW0144921.1 hypothetical protein [Sphingomicrobium sp. B8]
MTKFTSATGAALLLCAAAQPAMAQDASPPPPPPPPVAGSGLTQSGNDDTSLRFEREWSIREMLASPESYTRAHRLASGVSRCVVERAGAEAGSYLGGPMTGDEGFEALTEALTKDHRRCIQSDAQGIPMTIVNAALAEQVILAAGPELEPRAMSLNQDEADAFTTMGPNVKVNFDIIGRCAAVYSPGLTYEVLKTEPGSDEELSALNKLYTNTPECGLRESPDGAPTGYQRGVLAAGLYHWINRG